MEFNNTDRLQKIRKHSGEVLYTLPQQIFAYEFKFDYGIMLQKLEMSSLHKRRFILDGIFLTNLFKGRIY